MNKTIQELAEEILELTSYDVERDVWLLNAAKELARRVIDEKNLSDEIWPPIIDELVKEKKELISAYHKARQEQKEKDAEILERALHNNLADSVTCLVLKNILSEIRDS